MPSESSIRLAIVFFAGLGLLFVGIANALLRGKSSFTRLSASLLAMGAAAAGIALLTEDAGPALRVVAILAACQAACCLIGSDRLASQVGRLVAFLRQPAARWGTLSLLGLGIAIGAVLYDDAETERAVDLQMAELELLGASPTTVPVQTIPTRTDRGTPVLVKSASAPRDDAEMLLLEESLLKHSTFRNGLIRQQPANDRANCHGWVFTGGRFWVPGESVDRILLENGYEAVGAPQPGDLIVYRGQEGVSHTAIVRYVTPNQPVLVEGKWGCTGVYLHEAEKSVYGSAFTYFRSPREGHLLAGLTEPPASSDSVSEIADAETPDEFTE